jgi:hypothetical protein
VDATAARPGNGNRCPDPQRWSGLGVSEPPTPKDDASASAA